MTIILGVDPGLSGALVALTNSQPTSSLTMPTITQGKHRVIDAAAIARWVQIIHPDHAYIEDVAARPRQGVTSMWRFGHATGMVTGVICALGIPHTLVTPTAWKRRAGIPAGSDKDAARSAAVRLWPTWDALGTKTRGQACADAALIALHGDRP